MEIKKLLITGDPEFIYRHQFLFEAMLPYCDRLEILSRDESLKIKISVLFQKFSQVFSTNKKPSSFHKSGKAFILKSQQVENKIRSLSYTPDLVFHLYGLWSPFWDKSDIPYTMLLDYTMSLAEKTWLPWVPFINQKERDFWIDCERQAYERSHHIFTMSNLVKFSLIESYGIDTQKITVIGSSGNFKEPYEGNKIFGSKQILFNGSDFERKGGELVIAAFKQVKQVIPEAKLVIIGKKLASCENGIDNPGSISIADTRSLLLKTDLVVAPAYCEPFGLFLVEAMNYGVPCIVSANGGMPEIVDNEVNGVVIDLPTSDLLATQIIRLLSNVSLLKSMSIQAREKVRTKFNWSNIAKNIIQTLSN